MKHTATLVILLFLTSINIFGYDKFVPPHELAQSLLNPNYAVSSKGTFKSVVSVNQLLKNKGYTITNSTVNTTAYDDYLGAYPFELRFTKHDRRGTTNISVYGYSKNKNPFAGNIWSIEIRFPTNYEASSFATAVKNLCGYQTYADDIVFLYNHEFMLTMEIQGSLVTITTNGV